MNKLLPLLKSKLALAGFVLLALFFAQLHIAQWQRKKEIDKLISELSREEEEVIQKNEKLKSSLELLQTDGFKERVAREQLELKKEGEIVVRFQEGPPQVLAAQTKEPTAEPGGINNYEKWITYFFKSN